MNREKKMNKSKIKMFFLGLQKEELL